MPSTVAHFRTVALSLPHAVESAHCGHPDFRVDGRIFATLSGEAKNCGVLRLTPEQQEAFCAELPQAFEPVQGGWGRTGMTYVHLEAVEHDTLLGALATAHRNLIAKLATGKQRSARRRPSSSGRSNKSLK
jgi:hypothetical protein